jgi:integrase
MPVDAIDTKAVLATLRPIWAVKPETASRARARIESVLNAARALGHINENRANPARSRGHLDALLPNPNKVGERGNHSAMPYADVPAFMARLRARLGDVARALEFAVLTAARTAEVTGMRWCEVDLGAKLWTIPKSRMKAGREDRVPLSDAAYPILAAKRGAATPDDAFVFSARAGHPLSPMALIMALRAMKVEASTHGFRSSFRDWAGDETNFRRETAEAALAHTVGDKAEQAYRRGDALAKRRGLMQAWADHCDGKRDDNVVSIAARRA